MKYSQIQSIRNPLKRKVHVQDAYLTYFNDFLTVEAFAEYLECTNSQAAELIREGKHWNALPVIEAIEA